MNDLYKLEDCLKEVEILSSLDHPNILKVVFFIFLKLIFFFLIKI